VFVDNAVLTANQLNSEFNNLLNALSIANADISASANISTSKINASFPSGAMVGTTDAQTLSNKTLTSPVLTTPTVTSSKQTVQTYAPAAGGTATIDLSLGSFILLTMPVGNVTVAFANGVVGQFFVIRVLQDSVGSKTVVWPGGVSWAGSTPVLTTAASKADMLGFATPTSTTAWDGCIVFQNR